MSAPIVIELQRLASDGACPVDELLRKALIVATKLQITDFMGWINCELKGYASGDCIPKYRMAQATLHVFNPVQNRLIPYLLPDELASMLQTHPMAQPVANLVELSARGENAFHVQLPPNIQRVLIEGQGRYPMQPVMQISRVYVTEAINAVRNTILDWALRLEQQGILGEGMRFSSEEKAIAMTSQNIHIGSFQGILGNVEGSTVTQKLEMSVHAGDFNSLKKALTDAGVEAADIQALNKALAADSKPTTAGTFGPQTSSWIGNMISKAASGAWKVTLDTASKLLPAAIAAYYGLNG